MFTVVSTGVAGTPMPAFGATLREADRWAVVGFLRTLSLDGAPGTDAGAMEPDHAAELADVRRVVDAAVEAHRRGDPDAHAIATNAYLRFEPLERFLAERDAARVEALEQSFVTFRTALRDPSKGDPDALGRQLSADLDAAAALLRPAAPRARRRHPGLARAWRSSRACSSPREPTYPDPRAPRGPEGGPAS